MVHLNASKGHQFFALRVDQELQSILFQSLATSMNHIDVGFSEQYRPELEAIVASAYYLFAYVLDKPTPGMAVFQLALHKNYPLQLVEGVDREKIKVKDDEESDFWSKFLLRYLPVMVVLAQYVHKRLDKIAIMGNWREADQKSWKHMMYRVLKILEISFRVAGVANTLLFLWFGVYPTLLQRISGVQMLNNFCDMNGEPVKSGVGINPSAQILQRTPAEGYSASQVYLKTRQIGWSVFTQFMGTLLWVFDWPSIRVESRRFSRRVIRSIYSGISRVSDNVRGRWLWLVRKVMLRNTSERPGTTAALSDSSSDQQVSLSEVHTSRQRASELVGGEAGKYDCTCCGASPAEVPYVSNCSHIFCYSCIYHITKGFTATNRRRLGLIRRDAAGGGEAEEKRRDKALEDPFRNSLGVGPTHIGDASEEVPGHPDNLYLNASTSTGDFIGVSASGASTDAPPADDDAEDIPQYLCPICDTVVDSGERFSLI